MPADAIVRMATEVGSRAELEQADSTAFYRENQDLVFKIVADRQTHLTPETDDPFVRAKTFGTFFVIETGLQNDSPNVLADFERGVDDRGSTSAVGAQVSQVRSAWGYRPDAINWWDVTADGDGAWGFGDYSFELDAARNWTPFPKLNIDAILGGVKAGYEVLIRDASDGLISVGKFDSGLARVYLDQVDARFLDEVEEILIRVDERDLMDSAVAAGAFTRVHLLGLYLDAGNGPRFDFLDDDAISSLVAQNAGVIDARARAGSDPMARITWEVAANGDGLWGHIDMRFAVNNENWQAQDWLRIDTIIQGVEAPYTVYLRDKDDGYTELGRGARGAAYFDLDHVEERYLDRVNQVLIRVEERDLAPDAETVSPFAQLTLTAIDTIQGDFTLAGDERGVDLRGSTTAFSTEVSDVRAAWQDRTDSINYWDIRADGDGQFGHADYMLDLGQTMDWQAVSSLKVDTVMGGVKADYEIFLHDAGDGAISLGKFGEGLVGAALSGVEERFLDEVQAITIRTSERDLTNDPGVAGAFSRVHLYGLYLSDDLPPLGGSDHFVFHNG